MNSDQLNRLGQTGGQIVANNSQGINARTQWLAEQQAQRMAAQQPAPGPATMGRQEAYDLYMASGGRSGSFARQMGDEYKPVWHQGGPSASTTLPSNEPSWGQRMNAEAASWNGLIDRLDEAAVADGGGPITALAALARTPARSFLGFMQGAVSTTTLADPAVRAQISNGLGQLLDDPSIISSAARRYYETHSVGEMAADAYVGASGLLMGNATGSTLVRGLNKLPVLGADVGELAVRAGGAALPNRPALVPYPGVPYAHGQSGAISVGGRWIDTVTADQRLAFIDNGYLDPKTNKFVPVPANTPMHVDHIFPVKKIIDLPGLSSLTKEQMIDILQDRIGLGNIQPLLNNLNLSKKHRMGMDWKTYKKDSLNFEYRNELQRRQDEIRDAVIKQIKLFSEQNRG